MIASIPLINVIIAILVIAIFVLLIIKISQLEHKLRAFMVGKDGLSLENTLEWLTKKSANIDETILVHKEALEMIDKRVKKSIRGYSLVHYDAYENAGGQQSFASGLIDENEDGYILSIITNRNHTGIYAKKINRGIAESSLSKEENEALLIAKKSLL